MIYGRSDATINRQGVRMGTSEIYRAAGAVEEVEDALVVDIPSGDGEGELRMILFVVLRAGLTLDERLEGAIKRRIREDCSPRHVPNEVRQIEEVPRTLSGKALEVPVKRILMGAAPEQAASVDSLANPRRSTTSWRSPRAALSRGRRAGGAAPAWPAGEAHPAPVGGSKIEI